MAGLTEIGSVMELENLSPVTIRQTTGRERVREKLWATEICDCSNLEKTKLTNEKTTGFMAGGVLLLIYFGML